MSQFRADPPKRTSFGMFWVVWSCDGIVIDSEWVNHEELDWIILYCKAEGWDWTARYEARADLTYDEPSQIQESA